MRIACVTWVCLVGMEDWPIITPKSVGGMGGQGKEEKELRPDIIEQLLGTSEGPKLFLYMTSFNPNSILY